MLDINKETERMVYYYSELERRRNNMRRQYLDLPRIKRFSQDGKELLRNVAKLTTEMSIIRTKLGEEDLGYIPEKFHHFIEHK